jgi:hypothetical protein
VGVADSDSSTFADPHWPGLGVRLGRAVAPYDVALTAAVAGTPAGDRRVEFDAWVQDAAQAGVRPLVALQARLDPARRRPDGSALAPSARAYTAAMRAFVRTYPSVRTLTPWNEPNFRDAAFNPLVHKPRLAASYFRALVRACGRCTVAAGEFAGIPGDPYVKRYQRALGSARPAVWSFTAHTDANRFQANGDASAPATHFFLSRLGGRWAGARIWIDEIGAYFRDENGKVWGDASQAQTAGFILGLGSLSPRIQRIYYYNLSNECSTASRCAVQDRGLVSPQPFDLPPGASIGYDIAGRLRPAYAVIAGRGPVVQPAA